MPRQNENIAAPGKSRYREIMGSDYETSDASHQVEEGITSHFHSNFESISNVDREAVNGGTRTSNWKDARETRTTTVRLEDGAD